MSAQIPAYDSEDESTFNKWSEYANWLEQNGYHGFFTDVMEEKGNVLDEDNNIVGTFDANDTEEGIEIIVKTSIFQSQYDKLLSRIQGTRFIKDLWSLRDELNSLLLSNDIEQEDAEFLTSELLNKEKELKNKRIKSMSNIKKAITESDDAEWINFREDIDEIFSEHYDLKNPVLINPGTSDEFDFIASLSDEDYERFKEYMLEAQGIKVVDDRDEGIWLKPEGTDENEKISKKVKTSIKMPKRMSDFEYEVSKEDENLTPQQFKQKKEAEGEKVYFVDPAWAINPEDMTVFLGSEINKGSSEYWELKPGDSVYIDDSKDNPDGGDWGSGFKGTGTVLGFDSDDGRMTIIETKPGYVIYVDAITAGYQVVDRNNEKSKKKTSLKDWDDEVDDEDEIYNEAAAWKDSENYYSKLKVAPDQEDLISAAADFLSEEHGTSWDDCYDSIVKYLKKKKGGLKEAGPDFKDALFCTVFWRTLKKDEKPKDVKNYKDRESQESAGLKQSKKVIASYSKGDCISYKDGEKEYEGDIVEVLDGGQFQDSYKVKDRKDEKVRTIEEEDIITKLGKKKKAGIAELQLKDYLAAEEEGKAIEYICNQLDMHGEDAEKYLEEWKKEHYDDRGEWIDNQVDETNIKEGSLVQVKGIKGLVINIDEVEGLYRKATIKDNQGNLYEGSVEDIEKVAYFDFTKPINPESPYDQIVAYCLGKLYECYSNDITPESIFDVANEAIGTSMDKGNFIRLLNDCCALVGLPKQNWQLAIDEHEPTTVDYLLNLDKEHSVNSHVSEGDQNTDEDRKLVIDDWFNSNFNNTPPDTLFMLDREMTKRTFPYTNSEQIIDKGVVALKQALKGLKAKPYLEQIRFNKLEVGDKDMIGNIITGSISWSLRFKDNTNKYMTDTIFVTSSIENGEVKEPREFETNIRGIKHPLQPYYINSLFS